MPTISRSKLFCPAKQTAESLEPDTCQRRRPKSRAQKESLDHVTEVLQDLFTPPDGSSPLLVLSWHVIEVPFELSGQSDMCMRSRQMWVTDGRPSPMKDLPRRDHDL
mmetsp:Transcript_9169/g.17968  ORF Transcript_9169/g.17968 Transcript_9169/m.17968 type:complete len:107 (-) Transcript_9169:77-397(-)